MPVETIRVRNVKVGRAFNALAEVKNCEDVEIDGLVLGKSADSPFVPRRFEASGDSAEKFAEDGRWSQLIRQVRPGDEVVVSFPPSPTTDRFILHVRDQGGRAIARPIEAP